MLITTSQLLLSSLDLSSMSVVTAEVCLLHSSETRPMCINVTLELENIVTDNILNSLSQLAIQEYQCSSIK